MDYTLDTYSEVYYPVCVEEKELIVENSETHSVDGQKIYTDINDLKFSVDQYITLTLSNIRMDIINLLENTKGYLSSDIFYDGVKFLEQKQIHMMNMKVDLYPTNQTVESYVLNLSDEKSDNQSVSSLKQADTETQTDDTEMDIKLRQVDTETQTDDTEMDIKLRQVNTETQTDEPEKEIKLKKKKSGKHKKSSSDSSSDDLSDVVDQKILKQKEKQIKKNEQNISEKYEESYPKLPITEKVETKNRTSIPFDEICDSSSQKQVKLGDKRYGLPTNENTSIVQTEAFYPCHKRENGVVGPNITRLPTYIEQPKFERKINSSFPKNPAVFTARNGERIEVPVLNLEQRDLFPKAIGIMYKLDWSFEEFKTIKANTRIKACYEAIKVQEGINQSVINKILKQIGYVFELYHH
jgi:hypothetical protein